MITIGNVKIEGKAILAPMAGVTDRAFREVCAGFGAAYVISEMVSAKALEFSDKKSRQLMELGEKEHPAAIQLFGCEPEVLAKAAEQALAFGPELIDLNMGCPAPKVTCGGNGSALMKNPALCGEIVKAVISAVNIPVTVKIRKGWDAASVNAIEVAQICEDAGAAAIAVHGRTRAEMYSPPADWEIIRQVKRVVKIPVIGNGDVDSPQAAAKLLEETGCDLVMCGRGALGNPWLFRQINAYLSDAAVLLPEPSLNERLLVMLKHINLMCQYKDEHHAMNEARKHVGWYLKGMRGAAEFRRRAGTLASLEQLDGLVRDIIGAQEELINTLR